MSQITEQFEARVMEIDAFYQLAKVVDEVEVHKASKLNVLQSKNHVEVTRVTQQVCRATCFMLLYNLVESTVRNILESHYDLLNDRQVLFEGLSKSEKLTYLQDQIRKMKVTETTKSQKLTSLLKVIEGDDFPKFSYKTHFSGNLDFESIMKALHEIGIVGPMPFDEEVCKSALRKIKLNRNKLAHGKRSFSEIGQFNTWSDLSNIKDVVYDFASSIVSLVDRSASE